MFDVGYLGCALIIAVSLAFKVRGWRQARSAQLAASCLCHGFTATAFFCAAPVVYRLIGTVSGVPNLATLAVYGCITGFSGSAQALALLWTTRTPDPADTWPVAGARVRRRLLIVAALLAAMTALFAGAAATGRLPGPSHPLDFDTTYAPQPAVAAFLFVYQGSFAFALLGICQACRRHADELASREPDRVAVRTGVRMISTGCVVALGYVLCKVVAIGAAMAGRTDWNVLSTVAGPLFASIGALMMCAGFIYPAQQGWQERRRDFVALRPLWLAAAAADRNILLDPVPPRLLHRLAVRDLRWRLSRCTAEIRDAQLAMRVWEDPRVAETAQALAREQGWAEEDVTAAGSAAALLGAIRARKTELDRAARATVARGLPVEAVTAAVSQALSRGLPFFEPDRAVTPESAENLRAERARLVRISKALGSAPVVEALRRTERLPAAAPGPRQPYDDTREPTPVSPDTDEP